MISLFVSGLPIAQGRPRFKAIRMGQFTNVRVYDPTRSAEWKRHIRATVHKHLVEQGIHYPLTGPIMLGLRFVLPRPKALPKRITKHVKKPDLDNLIKAVKDALGRTRAKRKKGVVIQPAEPGLVYRNDAQVFTLSPAPIKVYGKTPGVRIRVKEVAS